ncbi:DEAD/DEAH box helicase, partial [bacterium]
MELFKEKEETYVSVSPLLVPVDKLFDYRVPEELLGEVTLGSLVVVPFGSRRIFAMAVRISDSTDVPEGKIKDVESMVEDFQTIPSDLLSLCIWISKMYLCPLNSVMESVFPFHKKMSRHGIGRRAFQKLQEKTILEKKVTLNDHAFNEAVLNDFDALSKTPARRRLARILANAGGSLSSRRLLKEAGTSMSTVKALEKQGYVTVDYLTRALEPMSGGGGILEKHHVLIPEQEQAYKIISKTLEPQKHEVFGSGKTEVYMHAVRDCLEQGKRVIILVPEIALATQIISRFLRR